MNEENHQSSKIHEAYVQRVKARLARPSISVEDARDGILDCFVSTYHEGLTAGLRGIVGVEARPDEIARVAAGMFRKRLKAHGVTFEAPTIDALAAVKEEVDQEFHFAELPTEIRGMHDKVCNLMIAKAEGLIKHQGDRSVLQPRAADTQQAPAVTLLPVVPVQAPAPPSMPRSSSRRPSPTTLALRAALVSHCSELIERINEGASLDELEQGWGRGDTLLRALRQFD